MTTPFSCPTKFTSDKAHSAECSSELMTCEHAILAYCKAVFLSLFGILLVLFTDIALYAAWFFFSLSILKTISIYYQEPYWLARQRLSKVAKSNTRLIVNDFKNLAEQPYIRQKLCI